MPNVRQKEFAQEVAELLKSIINKCFSVAKNEQKSPYDVEISLEDILKEHKTIRCIATDDCVQRHFENLENRNLFIVKDDSLKLRRGDIVGKNLTILNNVVLMPEDKVY